MKKKLILLTLIPILFIGCDSLFDTGDTQKVYDGPPVVEFFPLEREANVADGSTSIRIQLIGEQRNSDLTVSFNVDGESTAEAGVHYNIAGTSVTIPAGSSSANINIDLIPGSIEQGEEVLLLNLEGGDGVEASPNLARSTVYIRG